MTTFHYCDNRFTGVNNSKEILEDIVQRLNSRFGNLQCYIHPEEHTDIYIDYQKTGDIKFHSWTDEKDRCQFWVPLVETSFMPFLDEIQVFPLR
jgi:hypothetical protein